MKITCRKCNQTITDRGPKFKKFDSVNITTRVGECLRCANIRSSNRVYGGFTKSPNKFLADLGFVREVK
jgi:hypothetical protein